MTAPLMRSDTPRAAASDLPYRISWMARSLRAGAHSSRYTGGTGMLRDVVPFLKSPDPRRIDLRQSLRDPFDQLHTRRFEQPASIDVVLLADVSGSMRFQRKSRIVAELAETLAHSARRIGDRFGFIACDASVRQELTVPSTRRRGGEAEMAQRILAFRPALRGTSGLAEAARSLAGRAKLIILVSDFQIPAPEIKTILDALEGQDVLPIILNDRAEVDGLPEWGLIEFTDLETAGTRLIFMRPRLKQRFIAAHAERMAKLISLLSRQTREPLVIVDAIDWQRLAAALLGASRC